MKIIIDSNRIIAALIKESTTRSIISDQFFEFISPDFIFTEIRKYEEDIIKKAKITKNEFEILLAILFENIEVISKEEYEKIIIEIKEKIEDPKDLPYLAVAILTDSYGIWSHDPDFSKQKILRILTNIDMLNISGKSKF
ncbi:hypothetical protein J4216_03450 [Candidatus Woesearchaeota archaeon]|nr:hypothetical protein [Candidatus Woesearchaeota archaeon]